MPCARRSGGPGNRAWYRAPLHPSPAVTFSWLRNGASGLRVRHDFPPLLFMIRGGVTGSGGTDGPLMRGLSTGFTQAG